MQPVLLLDAMGTLVRLDDPVPRLRAEVRERLGVELSAARAAAALRAEIHHYRAHMHTARDAASLAVLRAECAVVLAAAVGPPLAGAPARVLTEILVAALHFDAFPDAAPALSRVRESVPGVRIAVVSNWDAGLPEVLVRTGLAAELDAVVASAAVGAAKPDPAIFRAALRRVGGAPGRALHVGDSPAEDVAGARAAGVGALLLRRAETGGAPAAAPAGVELITTLAVLPAHVSSIA